MKAQLDKKNQAELLKNIGCRLGAMTDKKFAKSATQQNNGAKYFTKFTIGIFGLC